MVRSYGVFAARALSARSVSFVDGIPIFTLSTGETFRLVRGTLTVSTGVAAESIFIPDMLDESVDIVDALSVCWLCVGVAAAAPVPYCEESVVGAVVAAGAGVGSGAGAGAGSAAGAGAGVLVTSPFVDCVDVCEPSLVTRI